MFTEVLSLLADSMDNLLIKEGNVRQYSNEKRYILNIDISSLISDKSILLFGIRDKARLLDTLRKQEAEVKFIFSKNKYEIVADVTTISITPLQESLFRHFYLDKDEYDKLLDDYQIIGEYDLENKIANRLSTFSTALASRLLRIEFGEDIVFKITASDNNSPTVIKLFSIKNDSEIRNYYSMILTKSIIVSQPKIKMSILVSPGKKKLAIRINGELRNNDIVIPLEIISFGDLIEEDGSEILNF
jgi:hypothetical protein